MLLGEHGLDQNGVRGVEYSHITMVSTDGLAVRKDGRSAETRPRTFQLMLSYLQSLMLCICRPASTSRRSMSQARRVALCPGACRSISKLACATAFVTFACFYACVLMYCQIRSGPMGSLYRPDTFITSNSGAGNNWAKGCAYALSRIPKLWIKSAVKTTPKVPKSSTPSWKSSANKPRRVRHSKVSSLSTLSEVELVPAWGRSSCQNSEKLCPHNLTAGFTSDIGHCRSSRIGCSPRSPFFPAPK
jgi:hypothetical protein